MSFDLRFEINSAFVDADSLVNSQPCSHAAQNASNNGVMYTGEYVTLLHLLGQSVHTDDDFYGADMCRCLVTDGLYQRSPENNRDLESVDDYYGLCAGYYYSQNFSLGKAVLDYGFKWKAPGCYDNLKEGAFQWNAFLWRQPQLMAMMYWAAGKQAPLPLRLYTAFEIATACIGAKQTDGADKWRLTWLIVKVASEKSWICRQASKLWRNRLKSVWTNMAGVYGTYYQGVNGQPHPFTTAMQQLGE